MLPDISICTPCCFVVLLDFSNFLFANCLKEEESLSSTVFSILSSAGHGQLKLHI